MFNDLIVVEFASVLAGPLAGSFFAELGARVIKIENKKTGGDVTRRWKLPTENRDKRISAYYCAANYGKESIYLDLTDRGDYSTAMNWVSKADVVILNMKSGATKKLGLDFDILSAIKKDLIYASLSGFGKVDPRPAFDVALQAETGFLSMTGEPGRLPVKMPVALIDVLAAHHLKEAILCGLIKRMRSGEGSEIHISLYQAALASLANQATNWLMAGHVAGPMGSKHPNIAPYGDIYRCADDRLVVLAVGSDRQFAALADLLNIPKSAFESNTMRLQHREKLNAMISDKIVLHDARHWEKSFTKLDIPYGLVRNIREVLEDPEAEKSIITEPVDGIETSRMRTALI